MPKPTQAIILEKKILFGFLRIRKTGDGKTHLKCAWIMILSAVASLVTIAWLSLFSAVFIHFKYRRDYHEASYIETLALPFHRAAFEKRRGDYYIKTAFSAVSNGNLESALNMFRAGLARSPSNLRARIALSEFYEFLFYRPELAVDLLIDGIPFLPTLSKNEQLEYVQNLFETASRNQLENKILNTLDLIKGSQLNLHHPEAAPINYQIATAYRNIGRAQESAEIIKEYHLTDFSEGIALKAQLIWDSGTEYEAITLLKDNLDKYNQNSPIYEKIIHFLRENSTIDRARQYSFLYEVNHPNLFKSHLSGISHLYEYDPKRTERLGAKIEEYLRQFSDNHTATMQLAVLCSKHGDTAHVQKALLKQLSDKKNNHGLLMDFIVVESDLRGKRYEEAFQKIKAIESRHDKENPLSPDLESIERSLKIAIFHGLRKPVELKRELDLFFNAPIIKIDRYLAVARLLLEIDAPNTALKIMEHCVEKNPRNANINQVLVTVYLKTKDAESLTQTMMVAMQSRRLPNKILSDVYDFLSSDQNYHIKNREKLLLQLEKYFDKGYLYSRYEHPRT